MRSALPARTATPELVLMIAAPVTSLAVGRFEEEL